MLGVVSNFAKQLPRALHRHREVTASNTIEVVKFFSGFLRNCINCVHSCADHSSLDFMIYFIYMFIHVHVSSVCKDGSSLLFLTTDLLIECYFIFL